MSELFRSTAYRVALVYSAAFALAVVLLGGAFYLAVHQALLDQLDGRIENEVIELSTAYRNDGLAGLQAAIDDREQPGLSGELGYAVFDASGQRVIGSLDTPLPPGNARDIVFQDPLEGPDPARAMVLPLGDELTLVVAADRAPLDRIRDTIITLLLVSLGVVLVIGISGGLLLGAYLRKRLGALSTSAEAIMAGDLSERMGVSGQNDEFDRLAITLNAMLDRIGGLMDNLRQVSSDIAHDLRTPLSQLRTGLEKSLTRTDDRQGQRRAIETAIGKTDHLLSMFSALLRISEVESQRLRSGFKRFDLSALLDDLCQSYAPAIEDGGQRLQWSVPPGRVFEGDRELLAQAMVNLLENAQKHTPQGTLIELRLVAEQGRLELTVADKGPGVPEADRARISGRFVRLETARTQPGNGLGLNLVAAIVELHHGRLRFEDNEPGLRVSILLPAEAAA